MQVKKGKITQRVLMPLLAENSGRFYAYSAFSAEYRFYISSTARRALSRNISLTRAARKLHPSSFAVALRVMVG